MTGKVTVLGGGAMGTGCSVLLAERTGLDVTLWTRSAANSAEIAATRENRRLLPGIRLPDAVTVTSDVAAAASGAGLLVVAIPTAYLRQTLGTIAGVLPAGVPVVSVVKGIENDTFFTPSRIICDVLGQVDVVALCGPSHAEEFARRLPASVVVAGTNDALLREVQRCSQLIASVFIQTTTSSASNWRPL
jgi:glycerol-3-phosphate dehydrogenase (NAD(P)+)